MLSKEGNHYKKKGTTKLAAIRITHIDDSLEVTIPISLILYAVVW